MHAYEAAFVSWGRHAVKVSEASRVSVFLQALTQKNKDFLGLPGSPLRGADDAPTFRECCGWLRTFEQFGPSPEELLLEHTHTASRWAPLPLWRPPAPPGRASRVVTVAAATAAVTPVVVVAAARPPPRTGPVVCMARRHTLAASVATNVAMLLRAARQS